MPVLYPVFLNLSGKTAFIAGGGAVAERKAGTLLKAGARIRLVSPTLTPNLGKLATQKKLVWRKGTYRGADLTGSAIAFACTNDRLVNRRILKEAARKKIPAQSVTDPETSDFHVPASLVRGSLQIALSTGGASPALARLLRERAETLLPEGFEHYAAVLDRVREWQLSRGEESEGNAGKFRKLVRSRLEQQIVAGDWKAAAETLGGIFGPAAPVQKLLGRKIPGKRS